MPAGGLIGGALFGGLASAATPIVSSLVAGTAIAWSTVATQFAIGAAMGLLGSVLSPKPEIPNFNQDGQQRVLSFTDPVAPHQLVYGRVKLSGPLVFMHTTDNSSYLHLVVVLASHEIAAIDEVFIDETLIFLDSNGDASGKYEDHVHVEKFLGTSTQAACSTLISAAPTVWTSSHRLRGLAYLYVRLKHNPDLFGGGLPNISCIVRGKKVYDPRSVTTAYSNNASLCIRDYLLDTTYGLGAASTEIDDTNWWNSEATTCDTSTTISDEYNLTYPTTVTSNQEETGEGHYAEEAFDYQEGSFWKGTKSSTYLQMYFSTAKRLRRFQMTCSGETATLRDSAPTGWILYGSNTGAFAGEETSINTQSGLSWSLGETKTISFTNGSSYNYYRLTFSNNNGQSYYAIVALKPFVLTASESKYTLNGVLSTDAAIKDNIQAMLSGCAGKLVWSQGYWKLYTGIYRTPTVTLDEDDIRDGMTIQTRHSKRDLFNRVRGTYVSEQTNWQPADFAPVTNATYLTEDSEEELWLDMQLPFTTSNAASQRLAKIELEKVRQQITIQMRCALTAFQVTVGDTVSITNTRMGWSSKAFEVLEWSFSMEENEEGIPTPYIVLLLRETASAVYSWSTEETTKDPAPDTNLPSGTYVLPPQSVIAASGNENLIFISPGLLGSRIKVSWTAHPNIFVSTGGKIQVWAKQTNSVTVKIGAASKVVGPDAVYTLRSVVAGSDTSTYISDVVDGGLYSIQVHAVNQLGVKSKPATITHTVTGKSAPPSNVEKFLVSQNGKELNFLWIPITDIDLDGYEIRYGISTTTWANAKVVTKASKTSFTTSSGVPPGTWAFFIKAIDTSGNYSQLATKYTLTIINTGTVIDFIQDDTFTGGTLTNFILHWSDKLVPDSTMLASAMTDAQLWDTFVYAPYTECTYVTEVLDGSFDDTVRTWGTVVAALGPSETTGSASQHFELFYRLAADPVSSAVQDFDSIDKTGTFTNCIYHWSDAIVPDSQSLASAMTDAQLWDTFVYDAYSTCTYEAPEVDLGSDRNVFFTSQVNERQSPTESSVVNAVYQIDYKAAAGSYDGYEDFTSGKITTVRYIKQKITLSTGQGVTWISSLAPEVDSFELWDTVGEKTGRYFQGRVKMDTSLGVAYISRVDFTVDLLDQVETAQAAAIGAGGSTITYTNRFHGAPRLKVTPIGTAARNAVVNNTSGTSFDVRIFDDTGTGVAASIDWEAVGT